MLKIEALILSLHTRCCLPLPGQLQAVRCLELPILARSVVSITLVEIFPLCLSVGVVSLISFPAIRQVVSAQAHFLLLDLSTILAILSLLSELSLLKFSLVLLCEEIAHQAKALGETVHPATGI
ncbi:hypothetical protein [Pseudomonas palleroniana]|uniref:hypothetical protein n=1 Tax=Pseudomonas palleroniana TaxID=191390 RepID=UPI0018E683BE|nr:hypothetical protein [Pseudomonas palleroniana]MBI6911642.1 hypothetical protein [Pseudomonas palleroniana]